MLLLLVFTIKKVVQNKLSLFIEFIFFRAEATFINSGSLTLLVAGNLCAYKIIVREGLISAQYIKAKTSRSRYQMRQITKNSSDLDSGRKNSQYNSVFLSIRLIIA